MRQRYLHGLTLAFVVAAVVLTMPVQSQGCAFWDCMFGASPSSQTTYAPAYAPAPVYSAPAVYAPATCQPTCQPVAAPSCSPCETYAAPQSCNYATYYPSSYAPVAVAAYRPVTGVYPLTTYRPFLGTYQTRLVPYTTYRPYYAPAVVYAPVAGCAPCGGYSSCGSCNSGGCGVTYSAPASGCSSCSAGTVVQSSPATESYSRPNTSAPATFEQSNRPATQPVPIPEKTNKPASQDSLKPIQSETTPSSTPSPVLNDPNDRTAARPTYTATQVHTVAHPVPHVPVQDDGRWQSSKD